MKRPICVLVTLAGTLALTALPVTAQDSIPELHIGTVATEAHPDVRVEVGLAGDLGSGDVTRAFSVREDGQDREILRVRQVSTADLQVALVVDTSGSMGESGMADARTAATAFLDRLPASARIAVIGYDREVQLLSGFEAGRDQHRAAIDRLVADGDTSLFDAVLAALAAFPPPGADTRQAIVLLTDGADTTSDATLDDVLTAMEASDVDVRGIAYRTNEFEDTALTALADVTGGSVVLADDPRALTAVYGALAAELSTTFVLDYRSESNGTIDLRIEARLDGGIAAGTRSLRLPSTTPAPPVVAESPAPERGTVMSRPGVSARQLLYGGAALWFVALATTGALLLRPRQRRTQLWGAARRLHATNGRDVAQRATLLAERGLARHGRGSRLNAALERGGINLRPGEFAVLTVCAMVTGFAVGLLFRGWLAATLLGIVALVAARLYLSLATSRRQGKFGEQLGATLQLLSGSLRAGYSFMQAIDAVAREADEPSASEFSRVVVEARLGRDVNDALDAMAQRMQSEDFAWVVQAIEIHREVGGDLAEVLDTVAGTIRERSQVRRQVKVLSAEGRLSAWILAALPFGVGTIIHFTNRSYLADLTQTPIGWGMLAAGAVLMSIGGLWLRALVRIEF